MDLLRLGNMRNEISFLNPPLPVRLPAGIIADFPEVSFYTPYIRPIDHLYNLNRIQTQPYRGREPEIRDDVRLANQFINILKEWKNFNLNINDILPIYAAIFDWLDKDEEIYDSSFYGTIGAEKNSYIGVDPYFEIKNGFLDKLSEVLLIRGVKDKRISLAQWKKGFTTYPVGDKYETQVNFTKIKPRINVNLATFEEIVEFLKQFNQNNPYFNNFLQDFYDDNSQEYFNKSDEIAEALTKMPRSPLTRKDIKNKLSNIITKYASSHVYFIAYSYWYEIHLKTEIDNVKAEVRAVVSVDRDAATGKVKDKGLVIHNFLLR